jgi:hypothetical protein
MLQICSWELLRRGLRGCGSEGGLSDRLCWIKSPPGKNPLIPSADPAISIFYSIVFIFPAKEIRSLLIL